MSRYPYTAAADYIRGHVTDFDESVRMRLPTISRAEASLAMNAISVALGMTHEELAKKIADYARVLDGRAPASEGEQK